MKKTITLIEKLLDLASGKMLPASRLKGEWFRDMQQEGILIAVSHGSRKSMRAADEQMLRHYVASRYAIPDLEACRAMLLSEEQNRSKQVGVTGDSKFTSHRTFKGFLVNTYSPVTAQLHGKPFIVAPMEGSYIFISDYEQFVIPPEVIVVGIENAENFRHIARQHQLFQLCLPPQAPLLFVSRYPQSGDLVRWLQLIPNRYVHFGDLDLAGVQIYLNEYYRHLGDRASFLIPPDYETRLEQGSAQRYNNQYSRFAKMEVADPRLKPLVESIHRHHKGYDQEGYIE